MILLSSLYESVDDAGINRMSFYGQIKRATGHIKQITALMCVPLWRLCARVPPRIVLIFPSAQGQYNNHASEYCLQGGVTPACRAGVLEILAMNSRRTDL